MTKDELKQKLLHGAIVGDLLNLSDGQDCLIFKADKFAGGEQIIYVPDVFLNEIPISRPVSEDEDVDDLVSCFYTGDDFLNLVDGDTKRAKELFEYVDWQHPSSAVDEILDDE